MQNILVTGGAGFIGSNFIRYLLEQEPELRIINLDALTYAGSLANLQNLPDPDRHIFIQGNICDSEFISGLFQKYQLDTVVHFAAESHVDRSILGPGEFVQTNIVGTFTLLECARQAWLVDQIIPRETARFHHVSTDEVFGTLSQDDPPFNEETPYSPRSPYSASKAASDHLVRAYSHTYALPVTLTNCTNNYGPYQFPEKLIPLMILNAIEGKPLPVYGDGLQVRDWLYVEDHCEAIHLVLKKGRLGETYAIGGNNQPTNLEIVRTICDVMDELLPGSQFAPHASLIKYVQDRPGHDRRYAMDISKIQAELAWQPRQNLQSGLANTVRWYLDNPAWVAAIRQTGDYQSWIHNNYTQRGGQK
ncbi:MAG: dTDP-glucose 4,6-dehydratase [Chloroflexi bacterium]|nr:dTDP-glucose 4,6-dehydratase [Chloroflexota bacterium]